MVKIVIVSHLYKSRNQKLISRDQQVAQELRVVAAADLQFVRVEKVQE